MGFPGFIKFEKLLGLQKTHTPIHKKIKQGLKNAQTAWMKARNQKNNDLNSAGLGQSILKFKDAADLVSSVEEDVNIIFNNFYKRGVIVTFVFLFVMLAFIAVLVKVSL